MSILMRADLRSSLSSELYFGFLGFFFHNQHSEVSSLLFYREKFFALLEKRGVGKWSPRYPWQDKKRTLGRIGVD